MFPRRSGFLLDLWWVEQYKEYNAQVDNSQSYTIDKKYGLSIGSLL